MNKELYNKIEEVLKWTRETNSSRKEDHLSIEKYLNDWVDHYCFITTKIQIKWYNITGYIPRPHYGGYWMTYNDWKELKLHKI